MSGEAGKTHEGGTADAAAAPAAPGGGRARVLLLAIAVAFTALAAVKLATGSGGSTPESAAGSVTSVRNDAVADFEKAKASGKPIYVLFHSLTCQPCVEISAVADRVVPEYEGRVAFVNAITDDASGRELASMFMFQYIPTSFFLAPGASTVIESHTGTLSEAEMRAKLDALIDRAK